MDQLREEIDSDGGFRQDAFMPIREVTCPAAWEGYRFNDMGGC